MEDFFCLLQNALHKINARFKTLCLSVGLFSMEFTHELKEVYPNEIIEVRGNADALAITLTKETNAKEFIAKLKAKYKDLNEPQVIFIRCEDDDEVEKVVLV